MADLRAENPDDDAVPDEGEHQEQEINKRKGDMPQSSGREEGAPMRMHKVRMLRGKIPSQESFLQRLDVSVVQRSHIISLVGDFVSK